MDPKAADASPAPNSCRGPGPATRPTPPKSGMVPARLLQLRQLLRALQERQHPWCARENRQQLPARLLRLWQLLSQQPEQQPRSDPEAGDVLPAGMVQLRQLLHQESLTGARCIDQYKSRPMGTTIHRDRGGGKVRIARPFSSAPTSNQPTHCHVNLQQLAALAVYAIPE